ncbi:MAG: hypothetical protein AAFO07_11100, partial [Bacteroidota bacterium]
MKWNKILWLGLGLLFFATSLQAQYFGRNKPNYESFDFEVYQTPNFEIYHYLKNPAVLNRMAMYSEQWYRLHQRVFLDTIQNRNPIIFYNDHADFQQTNAIQGSVGVGTGGVTEAFKNRVIMPIAMSNQQTFHVLGHELVHAFQYNIVINGDSTSLRNIANLPLWMVEGLAEYMSIGSVDAHTSMWMRTAVLNDDVPSLKDLNNPAKYFPYRYGQAFWVFLTGLKGDDVIEEFYRATASYGFDQASRIVLGMSSENLSTLWQKAVKNHYKDFLWAEKEAFSGKKLFKGNTGRLNISPQISPNGRYVIFLSEKNLFSNDLFIADVAKGEIIRQVASASKSGHIDAFNYIESAGTWSPDSKRFAFVGFSRGKNVLIIKEALTGKTLETIYLDEVPAFSNPSWSPDGRTIVFSGLADGQHDLYTYNVRNGKVTQLTNDVYSELHPHWSADGQRIYYSTDRLSFENGRTNGKWTFNLAVLDVVGGGIEQINIFPGADNLNPQEDSNGNIVFLSNHDGYRNIYRYEPTTGKVYQLTKLLTGVSGITHYAPAISMSRKRDKVLYTYFNSNTYSIYSAKPDDFLNEEVSPDAVDFAAATLPRVNPQAPKMVDPQLQSLDQLGDLATLPAQEIPYKSKFQLDYIGGSAGVGVGVGNNAAIGTTAGVAGGIDMLFSDIVGNNQIFASAVLNGEISDFGGSVAYINRKNRLNWGGALAHIPFRLVGGQYAGVDTLFDNNGNPAALADLFEFDIQRIFQSSASVFAFYPFSTTLRIEAQGSFTRFSERRDRFNNYYNGFGQLIFQERERLPSAPGFSLFDFGGAIVGDNSIFGLTAPLDGHRFRIGASKFSGEFNYTAITADIRLYKRLKPVTLAFRAYHYGRYGGNGNQLFPLYLGNPWFIRGYNTNSAQQLLVDNGISLRSLQGSKMFVSNFEVRLPFTGPKQLAVIPSNIIFSDLNLFVDGGVAFFDFNQLGDEPSLYTDAQEIFSVGASLRVNLFGAMIVEPYYAFPIINGVDSQPVFGLNLFPGW